jgi:hypothetical protein
MATIEELQNHSARWRLENPPATYTADLLGESARDITALREVLIALINWLDDNYLSHTKSIGIGAFRTEPVEYSIVTDARRVLDNTDKKY